MIFLYLKINLVAPENHDCGNVAEEAKPADQRDADTLEKKLDPGHELGVPARRGAVLGSRQVHVRGPTVAGAGVLAAPNLPASASHKWSR